MKPKSFLKIFFLTVLSFQTTKGLSQATQGTNAISSTSYLGTSNNNDVVFKRQAVNAGLIATDKTSFGLNSFATPNSVSIGVSAGQFSSGTGYNTFIGNYSGGITTGNNNTFLGYYAGGSTTNGDYNIFIGRNAGASNVSGNNNIYIGNSSGSEDADYSSGNIFIGSSSGFYETGSNKLHISNLGSGEFPLIWGDFAQDQLKFNAKVGVGYGFGNYPTTAGSINVSNYNLFVKGGILTEEVRVSLNSTWADYVFHKDYNLKSLDEVEQFIVENGHLPNVPSAKQVKEDGIELGEMAKIQQEKIEELTLYIIEQNKINEKQMKEIKELQAQMKLLLEKQQ